MPKPRALLALPVAAALALGCVGYSNTDIHQDHQPEVQTGAGAVILWPGQAPAMPAPPPMPPAGGPQQGSGGASGPTGQASPGPGAPATAQSGGGAAPSVGDGGFTYIGGGTVHENTDTKTKTAAVGAPQIPILNILLWPFGALGAALGKPAVQKAVKLEQQPGQSQQSQSGAAPQPAPQAGKAAADPQGAYERSRLDELQRELASRGMEKSTSEEKPAPPPTASGSASASAATPGAAASGTAPGPHALSIAQELADLQAGGGAPQAGRRPEASPTPTGAAVASGPPNSSASAPPPAPPTAAGPSPAQTAALLKAGVADQVTDDNGDGRPDHWVYRQDGRVVREVFDANGDGKPDRVILYDPKTGEKLVKEEDTNLDGRIDTWVEYQHGKIARQRRDTNHDGFPDSWSYYDANGVLTRQEQDRNGDGFRDRIEIYKNGKLAREEEDRNGDGKIDLVSYYDAKQRIVRRDEDRDGDGLIDTRSYYKDGKLARREFVSEAILAKPIETEQLDTPAWSEGKKPEGSH